MPDGVLNLHVHTQFSDGVFDIDELCEAHLKCESPRVAGIGLADHLFLTPSSREPANERDFQRIFREETARYVQGVEAARSRWAGRMQIFCGCEINWPLNRRWVESIRELLRGLDFVLFEFVDWNGLTTLASLARQWPCPIGLAHTDVAQAFPNTSLDQIVRTMANARMFYEVNPKLAPLSRHDRWFAHVSRHRVRLSLGTDTHDDLGSIDEIGGLLAFVREHGLEDRLFSPAATAAARSA